jgi:DNA polymerase-3 subunit delta
MAKLDAKRVAAFLADPGAAKVVLLFGDDAGLVRERAETLVRSVTQGESLRIAELGAEAAKDPGALAAEAAMLPMLGGRMLVRVREASDSFAKGAAAALRGRGQGLVLLEAGELKPNKTGLRGVLEAAPEAQVIACYRERGADLVRSIGAVLGELGVSAEPAALDWLAQRLGEDRMLLRRELEKLALYVGKGARVTPEDCLACIAEGSASDLEDALLHAMAGEVAKADAALDAAFAEGANAVQVVRGALRHVQRLQQAGLEGGVEALRPPVFFRHKPLVERALRLWTQAGLETVGQALLETERRTKTTGVPSTTVARWAVMVLARQAAARSR